MKNYKLVLLIVIMGFLVYANSLFNGFVWDDEEQIVGNVLVHSVKNIPTFFKGGTFNVSGAPKLIGIYYRPLMTSFLSLLYTLFGPNPFFFHLFQVIIHITNSILVFLILKHFLRRDWLSFFLATLFLVHPVNTEAVVYISALQDALSFFFGSFAFFLIIKKNHPLFILIASIFIFFALLTKETAALFIIIIFLYLLIIKREKPLTFLIFLTPFLILYGVLRFLVAHIFFTKFSIASIAQLSFLSRLVNVPKIIFYYLKIYMWPWNIAVSQHWTVTNLNFSDYFLPLSIDLIFLFGLIYFGIRLFLQKSKHLNSYLFFLLLFIVSLGFHLQLFPLDMTVADRWFYLPQVGLLGMIGVVYTFFSNNLGSKKFLLVLTLFILLLLSFRTFLRNLDWRDGYTLYSRDILISKHAFDLENNIGVELGKRGEWEKAKPHFEKSIKLAPDWWPVYNNLAVYYALYQKNYEEAEKLYRASIAKGNYYKAYENLSFLLLAEKKYSETITLSEKGLSYFPNNTRMIRALVLAYYQSGNKEKALDLAKYLYQLSPTQDNKKLTSIILEKY